MNSQDHILSLIRLLRVSSVSSPVATQKLVVKALHQACKPFKQSLSTLPEASAWSVKDSLNQGTGRILQPSPQTPMPTLLSARESARESVREQREPRDNAHSSQMKGGFASELQHKIQQQAPWQEMFPILKKWYYHRPSSQLACKMVELGYVWSGVSGVEEILLGFEDFSFWPGLHLTIRKHLLRDLHKKISMQGVMQYFKKEAFSSKWSSYERLALFVWAMAQKEYAFLFRFHIKYYRQLHKTVEDVGRHFSLSVEEFRYCVSVVRMEQGHYQEALAVIKDILPTEAMYAPVCKLRRRIQTQMKNTSFAHEHAKVSAEVVAKSDWSDREQVLRHYLAKLRSEEGSVELAMVLNDLFAKKSLVPMKRPAMLSRYVGMCLEYVDLYERLPNIIHILSSNVYEFHSPAIDGAIWNHFLGSDVPDFPCEPWCAVAKFHRFMMIGVEAAQDLQEACEIFERQWIASEHVVDVDFAKLKRLALKALQQGKITPSVGTKDHDSLAVKRMQAMIHLCSEDMMLESVHIENYLVYVQKPDFHVLQRLLNVCISRKYMLLVSKVRRAFLEHGFLRNSDLKQCLMDAIQKQDKDFAWRIITVLQSRGVYFPVLQEVWKVSGEYRRHYQLLPLGREDILRCFSCEPSYDLQVVKVLSALLIVGYRIPELMAVASYKCYVMRWRTPNAGSLEEDVLKDLKGLPWLKRPLKRVSEGDCDGYSAMAIPLCETMVWNRFAILASYVFEYLGLQVISGDLLRLVPLIPMTCSGDAATDNPTKKATIKWFRSLSETERLAWLDLCALLRGQREDMSCALAKLVFCLVLLILPSHHEALVTMQRMRVPLDYLRDLERFVLSERYSDFRKKQKISSKVAVPAYASVFSE